MKIPKDAMRMARVIRKKVKRPESLPNSHGADGFCMRWSEDGTFWNGKCPMGMLPCAADITPFEPDSFVDAPYTEDDIDAFWMWWDYIRSEQAEEAMDALWPRGTATQKG